MSDQEVLAERLAAVERAVTDGDVDLAGVEGGDAVDRIETLDERLTDVEQRVADLEAATEALRGYVGNVRAVNEDVERRADAALARAESVERALVEGSVDSFWTDAPSVDPDAGAGWRDAASTAAGTQVDRRRDAPVGGTSDGTQDDDRGAGGDGALGDGGAVGAPERADGGRRSRDDVSDEGSERVDDLRAIVRRFREAL